ncbi:MAG TPA: RNA polymerase sigma factor [Gammaproteobacteria bacterium]|jgi:RNA polymerase sigma-70 factor (ECF subfamily)
MHDEALIKQAQNGDARAFEQLLGACYDTLYKFAYKWCGNREDAEDVTQQACLKLARSIGQFRFDAAFTSWLYRLVINCAKDWSKSQRRLTHADDIDQHADIAGDGEAAENKVLAWQVLVKLDSFPDGIKETILLVHAEGLTHGEAAKILGVKESTVSWRLHEARKTLNLLFEQGAVYD